MCEKMKYAIVSIQKFHLQPHFNLHTWSCVDIQAHTNKYTQALQTMKGIRNNE